MEGYIVFGWLGMFFFIALAVGAIVFNLKPREPAKSVACGVLAVICLIGGIMCFANAQSMQNAAEHNNQATHE